MSRNFKMVLQYEGTRYNGWQKQGNTSDTIQGKLEQILERMSGEPVEVHGSGRTDAGVHAAGQTANFRISEEFFRSRGLSGQEEAYLKSYLNRYLPEDIGVLSVEEVSERFHSRLSAERKTYRYQIETGEKEAGGRETLRYA
jgi:tRNA pseudouridine38-40 synthase